MDLILPQMFARYQASYQHVGKWDFYRNEEKDPRETSSDRRKVTHKMALDEHWNIIKAGTLWGKVLEIIPADQECIWKG